MKPFPGPLSVGSLSVNFITSPCVRRMCLLGRTPPTRPQEGVQFRLPQTMRRRAIKPHHRASRGPASADSTPHAPYLSSDRAAWQSSFWRRSNGSSLIGRWAELLSLGRVGGAASLGWLGWHGPVDHTPPGILVPTGRQINCSQASMQHQSSQVQGVPCLEAGQSGIRLVNC